MVRFMGNSLSLLNRSLKSAQNLTHASITNYLNQCHDSNSWNCINHKNYSERASGLGIRRQKLPPFPCIDKISHLKFEMLAKENFRMVRYGEHEYKECKEGFVQVYAHAQTNDDVNASAGFVVVYGKDHPMNICGLVERRQEINHAILYAILRTLQSIPEDSFKKVCICVREAGVINYVCNAIPRLSENSFRSMTTGRLIKDLETSMEINKILRMRHDITFRVQFIPTTVGYPDACYAHGWASRLSVDLTRAKKEAQFVNLVDLD